MLYNVLFPIKLVDGFCPKVSKIFGMPFAKYWEDW